MDGTAGGFRGRLHRVREFVRRDLWLRLPERRGPRALYQLLRMGVLTVEGALRSEVFLLSAALAFNVVFALVPLLCVMLAALKGFGGLSGLGGEVKGFLLGYVAPGLKDKIGVQIDDFIRNVDAAAIGIAGLLALVYTTLSLLTTVERAFNRIWGVQGTRPFLRRITVYWTILTVGPILLAASLAMAAFVQNQALYQWLIEHMPFFGKLTLILVPVAFSWIVFAGFYVLMPNTKVELRAALIGAVVAGTAWEAMKNVYVWYHTCVVAAYAFHGALGSIPVFLLWIYLSWIVVLFGAEVAFAVQNAKTYRRGVESLRISPSDRERLGLMVCVQAVRSFERGEAPPTPEEIAGRLGAPVRAVHEVAHPLVEKGILREAFSGDARVRGLAPGRDPAALTALEVIEALRTFGDPCALPEGDGAGEVSRLVERAQAQSAAALGSVTIKALAASSGSAPARSP